MKKDMKRRRSGMSKKLCALMLAGTLVFGMAATGCKKKDVDLGVEDGSDVSDVGADDDGNIEGKAGIPESCDESFDVGASGLSKIALEDDEIQAPKSSSMSVIYCEKMKYDNAAKQKIAEAIFDKDAGIYAYDYEHQTKSDLEEQIASYKEEEKRQEEQGYKDEWITEEIQNLENQLASAPDEYPAAGDYSSEEFLGSINGTEFTLSLSNGYEEDGDGVASGCMYMKQNVMDYKPCEGATDGWFGDTNSWGEVPEGSNAAKMTKDEAEQIAMDYISQICQSEMEITAVKDLVWSYYNNSTGEDIETILDGYCITFSKVIEGEKTLELNTWNVDNLTEDNASTQLPVESGQICMDDNGLLSLYWTEAYVPTGETEKNVSILSWSDMMTKLNENLGPYYEKYPTRYKKVEFNDIRLTYFPLATDKEGVIAYTPAWVLSQYEELADETQDIYPTQLVVINAIDGSIIDLKETAKALGTYYDYSEMDDEEGDGEEDDDTTDGDDAEAGDDTEAGDDAEAGNDTEAGDDTETGDDAEAGDDTAAAE